ncbi:MAG: alpha/beta hydrolase [Acidimicrobiia bacterium]|nr:alpha/beta hydrolase [Acidimicrobiia bacterium]
MVAGKQVLMVHGAWHGSWCWTRWVELLSEAGHRPTTVDLPGHADPGSPERIWNRLGEYIDAVADELRFLGPDTVVIGHSMGGLVVQRALERVEASLGILLASVPRSGVVGATIRTARRTPGAFLKVNAKLSMHELVSTDALARDAFFGDDVPGELVADAASHLQNESYLAYLQMFAVRPRPRKIRTPMRVIAAERDAIFSVGEQRDLARAHGTDLVIIEGAGHDLMLGPWSDRVAGTVIGMIDTAS